MTAPPRTLEERLRWSGLDAMTKHLSLGMFKLHAEAADALDAQSKLLAEAREALEPFAEAAESVSNEHPGWDHDAFNFDMLGRRVTLAPFRKARAVLANMMNPADLEPRLRLVKSDKP